MTLIIKRPTINDVARLSGVSKKTVSRVINDEGSVSLATRDKIKAIISDLNYSPDPQARGLSARRSFLLGIVYDNPNALYIADVQQGVLSICREAGYELVVHPSEYDNPDLINDTVKFVCRLKLDGVVLLSPISQRQDLVDALNAVGCPVVRLTSKDDPVDFTRIISVDRLGAASLARHFIELGHREIGLIMGPLDYWSTLEREEGFRQELATENIFLDSANTRIGGYSFLSGYDCGKDLLDGNKDLTAVFACNDEMAAGFFRAVYERGLRIPEDISVAGFDDSAIATRLSPALTTVKQPIVAMGQLAAKKLLTHYSTDNQVAVKQNDLLVPELVIRASTRSIEKAG